ncbi:MAG TPA: DUF1499 domain-containing protein [Thermoanaerobaculia bacterium]
MAADTEIRLRPCRRPRACVSTQAEGRSKMYPIPYDGPLAQAREKMLRILRATPRTEITEEGPTHIKAECRTLLFRFVDYVDLVFDDAAKVIHFRSASRIGTYDYGVNRRRMERIRRLFLSSE